ncbi:maleylpyruvate isomerase family mycothiol-dependent enzyme [Halostreptopolyspora alba]|uniref:Maleylpyruvate isomerase family mycothiol-dependent enzyme n=1 Tax=Halostreptopolyspora alba TaxID=2487137 RepID=A0A3N0E5A6_9ACTN|nr:maleylpyruvate isomerase family mycothiol-dependent enzyme [Nocardiopsaceae bacterium YIM 96095]
MTNAEIPPVSSALRWAQEGNARFTNLLATLDDAGLDAPSRLPGWSRRHVLAHLGANARGLGRLLHWARTDERTPMYPSREERDLEIERDARLSPAELRSLVHDSMARLSDDMEAFPDERWDVTVEASGLWGTIPASTIPWMRCLEVWVHTTDLDYGVTFEDIPPGVVDALIADATRTLTERGQEPPLALRPVDRDREWLVGAQTGPTAAVTGPASGIAAWVTGRGADAVRPAEEGTVLPTLGTWR